MIKRVYEDFVVGEKTTYGARKITKEEIIKFALMYDPQPFHIDEEAAKKTFTKTLIASGWHSAGIMMRMMCDSFIKESTSFGAPGVEELNWLKPVLPDDVLTLHTEVVEKKEMRSRPEMGMIKSYYYLTNHRGEKVLDCLNWGFQGRRNMPPPKALPSDEGRALAPPLEPNLTSLTLAFDDLEIGMQSVIGSHVFTSAETIAFAQEFDPQAFHLTEEGAKASYFGRLSASGWNTAAAFMKTMLALRKRIIIEQMKKGEKPKEWGPAAGFKNMKWLKPVYAGDTVTYANEVMDKRVSNSRPEWGLLTFRNKGFNQYGDQVFEFTGTVLIKR